MQKPEMHGKRQETYENLRARHGNLQEQYGNLGNICLEISTCTFVPRELTSASAEAKHEVLAAKANRMLMVLDFCRLSPQDKDSFAQICGFRALVDSVLGQWLGSCSLRLRLADTVRLGACALGTSPHG